MGSQDWPDSRRYRLIDVREAGSVSELLRGRLQTSPHSGLRLVDQEDTQREMREQEIITESAGIRTEHAESGALDYSIIH
jgi:hypothetical protein